jgi:hypothetical protein
MLNTTTLPDEDNLQSLNSLGREGLKQIIDTMTTKSQDELLYTLKNLPSKI